MITERLVFKRNKLYQK